MATVKTMSANEKYAAILKDSKRMNFVPGFFEEHLGKEAAAEYQRICDAGIEPIPETASPEEKFELAYKNWIWVAGTAFSFARERLSADDLKAFLDADLDTFRQTTPRAAVIMLNVVRALSPGAAFNMMATQVARQSRWMMPGAVTTADKNRAVVTLERCKALDYPHGEDVCELGCRGVAPRFFAEAFKVKSELNRQDHGCTMTVTPL